MENSIKMLEDIIPFNKFFFRSCYFHQLISAYGHFGVSYDDIIRNNLNIYSFNKKTKVLKTQELQLFTRKQFQKLTGIEQVREKDYANITKHIIDSLDADEPIIMVIDCYDLPFRKDTYKLKHIDHYILIYGYDLSADKVYFLEHSSFDNFYYEQKYLTFSQMERAHADGIKCLQESRDQCVKLRRVRPFDRIGKNVWKNAIAKKKKILLESQTNLTEGMEYIISKLHSEKEFFDTAEKYCKLFDNLRWNKLRQIYQFKNYINAEVGNSLNLLNSIIGNYTYLSAHMYKYCEQKIYENINFFLMETKIKDVVRMEKQVINNILGI